jgi:hypothetical protein
VIVPTPELAAGLALRLGIVRLGTCHVGRLKDGAFSTAFPGCATPFGNVGHPKAGLGAPGAVSGSAAAVGNASVVVDTVVDGSLGQVGLARMLDVAAGAAGTVKSVVELGCV